MWFQKAPLPGVLISGQRERRQISVCYKQRGGHVSGFSHIVYATSHVQSN